MRLPPLASLFVGVNAPHARTAPVSSATALDPEPGEVVAMFLNSDTSYWNGSLELANVTVIVVCPAAAFGKT